MFVKKMAMLAAAGLLTGCGATGGDSSPASQVSGKPSCQSYQQQVAQCRSHNSRYTGLEHDRKVVACLQGRGFHQRKAYYCGK
ncbi:hypothetical protein [Conchiformibius steedae]|uniref:hypothetical protein n=1 Tax=Conchiformibius steedae TaxID=153493 RepID=UPI0026F1272F|nr:hypothetical protein [Conchiformibius steedae]